MELVTSKQLARASALHSASQLDTANFSYFSEEIHVDYRYVIGLWSDSLVSRTNNHKQELQRIDDEVTKLINNKQKIDWKLIDMRKRASDTLGYLPSFLEYVKELKEDLEFLDLNPEHYE